MCSRYSRTKEKVIFYVGNHQISFGFAPRYNVAPSQRLPVIVEDATLLSNRGSDELTLFPRGC